MRNFTKKLFIFCGILFGFAVFPVLAQETEPNQGILINKQPLKDFAKATKQKFQKKEVDLDKPFLVETKIVLTPDGKLDVSIDEKTKQPKSKFVKTEGDPQMIGIAKKAIEAVGDSGWFGFLRSQGIEKIYLTVLQDADIFSVSIFNEQPTNVKANTIASGLDMLVKATLLADRNGFQKLGDQERILLSNIKVTAQEKNVIIKMTLPKAKFQEMIRERMKNSEPQSNG